MNRFGEIEVFIAVGKNRGITAAANALGVSKSHVSKSLSALEARIGVRLVNRTTRKLSLTPEGDSFLERCESVISDLDEAESLLSQSGGEARGVLRISAPMSLGVDYIAPLMPKFLKENELVKLEIDYNDRKADLVDEGFDLGVRVGQLTDSSLIVQKIAATHRYLLASPEYLADAGRPTKITQLSDHDCLLYSYADSPAWSFHRGEEMVRVPVQGRVKTNSGDAIVDACVSGLGFALLPDFIAAEAVQAGKLEILFPEWTSWTGAVWAVYPHKRHLSLKIRTFVDFLKRELGDAPWSLESIIE